MLEQVFLDWNGTLLADSWAAYAANNEMFKFLGIQPISKPVYQATFEIPIVNFYLRHGVSLEKLAANSEKLHQIFNQSYEPMAARCRTRNGARQLLDWLGVNEIRRILLSNHTQAEITSQLKRLGLLECIEELDASLDLNGVVLKASKEERLVSQLTQAGTPKERAAIIGDAPEDMEIGRRAGIWTIALTRGFYSTSRLRACRPDFLVNSLSAALNVLQQLHLSDEEPASAPPSTSRFPTPPT